MDRVSSTSPICVIGTIPEAELTAWLRHDALVLPNDLLELWQLTGDGDVVESEAIVRPTVASMPNTFFVEDDIESSNAAHAPKGEPAELYVFQQGSLLSAVRLSDQKFATLSEAYSARRIIRFSRRVVRPNFEVRVR